MVCPTGASRLCGVERMVEEVLNAVLPDKPFFRKHGGVTLSGGEPMAQPEFTLVLAQGIQVLVETCGYAPWTDFAALRPYVDGFLFDWKETDAEMHRAFTGVDNRLIRENLAQLHASGTDIVPRCPIIPGYNDRPDHFVGIGRLTQDFPHIRQVDLLPYHALGNGKRRQLGQKTESILPPGEETIQEWQRSLQSLCRVPVQR